jgi:uncharacterized protein
MVHAFSLFNSKFILDIGSGSVHAVDSLAYEAIRNWGNANLQNELLQCFPATTQADVADLFGEIEELICAGKLFAPESAGGQVYEKIEKTSGTIKALCLHVSHTCNLCCAYCFAKAGRYQGKEALMPFEIGKQAIQFLVENSGNRRHLEVDFFGGEPLMNWDVVKQIVAYARSVEAETGKLFRFTLTTNGMQLDNEVTDFCNREMQNVVLSLDGRKEVHNKYRVTPAGQGSYETIVPKYREFVKKRGEKSYYMRGTFTHNNPDFTNDLYHMADLGFRQLAMEPVVADPSDPCALTEEDIAIVQHEYEKLAAEMVRRAGTDEAFTFYHYLIDLQHGPCVYKRVRGCGSGTEYFAVTPTGDLYPCHQFVGDDAYKVGTVFTGIDKPDICETFRACNLYTKTDCKTCWAKFWCSGGCAANALHRSGNIFGVDQQSCVLFKKRLECAIWLEAIGKST